MGWITYDDLTIDKLMAQSIEHTDLVSMAILTQRYYCPAAIGCPTLVNGSSLPANTIRAIPFRVIKGFKITQLSMYLVSGGMLILTRFRYAIYKANPTTLLPKELLWQSSEITQSASGAEYNFSGIAISLPKGYYYFAIITSGSAVFRAFTYQLQDTFLLYQSGTQTSPIVAVQASYTYGAFPASFPANPTLVNGSSLAPDFFMFKIASL